MPVPDRQHPGYTLTDYASWDGRWELIRGVAYSMTPAPGVTHQRIVLNLVRGAADALDQLKKKGGKGGCEVFIAPTDVYLFDDTVVQPDLLVVCDPTKISERGIEGAPDLVVEVLSPGTAGKDVTRKRWLYESAKVREYLIVDPDERCGELLCLDSEGRYQTGARVEWEAMVELLGGQISIPLK